MDNFPFEKLRSNDRLCRELHEKSLIVKERPDDLGPEGVLDYLALLAERSATSEAKHCLVVKEVGQSFENRAIRMATIGSGQTNILLWTQMHGNEPTHTVVVLDLLSALVAEQSSSAAIDNLLATCTLHFVPMLNPDGAAKGIRKNAQGIDINRDAVDLATPEGRVLHQLVVDLKPRFAFNLHNQNAGKQVGQTGRVAAVSVMAPPLDHAMTVTPQMIRAKQLALEMFAAAERNLPGHATKYDADYMPTAFGEWVQSRGTTTVLLEAGGWPKSSREEMVRLHYVVLLTALQAIQQDRIERIDAAVYEEIPLNWLPD